jgi:Ca-activated chloride channel family protein
VDIVVALDMSGSMKSEDFEIGGNRVNRFHMARAVLENFIEKRPNDRLGLVVFATEAFISTPLTLDHDFLKRNLDRLDLGTIDENQTAIGSALGVSVNRLRELDSKSRIIILMTDGQNNAGKLPPLTAAEAAAALKVKVYTIGVGSHGKAPVFVGINPFTGERMYKSVEVDIDEDTLKKVAEITGGKYYRADNAERLQSIYREIDALEKTEKDIKKYSRHRELFPWAIAPGLGIVAVEFLLRHTRLRRLP